ncbi:MAG: hypothetical protein KDA57_09945 [Planctomycetales bacterium]|nr:hypothetical protein [Planctomycetales bacterium]
MSLNPLAPVTNHDSKLSRIFWFTSVSSVVALWLLRENIEPIDMALKTIDDKLGASEKLPLSAGYLLPAVAVGVISRIFRVHDRISDLLGIRERFDVDVIIAELATRIGIDLANVSDDELVRLRGPIMGKAFYQFTGSKNPQIDEHLIHQALDWWSWLWVVLEASLVFALTGLTLVSFGVYGLGIAMTFGPLAAAALTIPIIWSQCRRYAIAQVAAILSNPDRASEVLDVLQAAVGPTQSELAGWHVNRPGSPHRSDAIEQRLARHLGR